MHYSCGGGVTLSNVLCQLASNRPPIELEIVAMCQIKLFSTNFVLSDVTIYIPPNSGVTQLMRIYLTLLIIHSTY